MSAIAESRRLRQRFLKQKERLPSVIHSISNALQTIVQPEWVLDPKDTLEYEVKIPKEIITRRANMALKSIRQSDLGEFRKSTKAEFPFSGSDMCIVFMSHYPECMLRLRASIIQEGVVDMLLLDKDSLFISDQIMNCLTCYDIDYSDEELVYEMEYGVLLPVRK
jgi:hypothetical protein